MNIEISKQEAWKLLDAIEAYLKNYSVTGSVNKTLTNLSHKIKKCVES